jgi:uncharacterized protein YyaL (SSP411 family)
MHTNSLIHEKSPYLLQHAHNPVNWLPWGDEAFRKAREEDKPVFLSIGYSTCHWCHVMERESFEDESIAALLNRYYVPVKVDREERPDVDRIYMTFVQATTGSGGWPMSVFLTPDLKPFFGGTYFPPAAVQGHPGFREVLERVAEAWRLDRQRIIESSGSVISQLQQQLALSPGAMLPDAAALDAGFYAFRRMFDTKHGGFGGRPKFPRPAIFNFLLRYAHRTRNVEALEMVFATLNAMAHGGIHDHVGGGFHRYAVDARWFLPHFEKMLYDQAQLAISYLEAYQVSNDAFYTEVARGILDYVARDMTDAAGGFYSAEDADSAPDAAHPDEKREGAYYVWTREEIGRLLPAPAAEWAYYYFGIDEHGNVREDPHGEFGRQNVLYEAHSIEQTAEHFGRSVEEIRAGLSEVRRKLFDARRKRPRPQVDDKVLTAWNGLMISAFAKGAQALGEPHYLEAARRAADFLLARAWDEDSGTLLRRYRAGEAGIPGFLDDYAFFAQGLLDLYEAAFDVRYLETAVKLTEAMRARFEDDAGGFFSTEKDGGAVLRIKDDYDGAEPSGNSVAIRNLLRLGAIAGGRGYRESAERALQAFAARLNDAPVTVPEMLAALAFALSTPKQIVIAGARDAEDTQSLLSEVNRRFLPNKIVLLVHDDESRRVLASYQPQIAMMEAIQGAATAHVCENFTCKLPTADPAQFAAQLEATAPLTGSAGA